MTPEEISLVQASFARLAPQAEAVAVLFYDNLFALDPALRSLFPAEMAEQRRKLMAALAMAVQSLDRPEQVVPALQAMGRRHAMYGVRDEHYATVGAALMATLRQGLGPDLDAASEAAWSACYGLVATTMQAAARPITTAAA